MSTETHEEHEEREARNEAESRQVNERESEIRDNELWQTYVCECGDETCTKQVELTPEEYEQVRKDPTRFVTCPDQEHVASDVERVVEKHQRYWVVEKSGEAAEVAEELDPHSDTAS
jgi:hypothetical protein